MSAEKLITDHINIWTSAVQAKSASGRGSSKKRELYGIKKLRELILELAVRGKLVPQDPSDEPASVLLERIAAEKAQLLKTKSIKQPKLATVTTESLSESALPAGWTKCLLGELLPQFQNGASSRGDKDGKLTTVLRLADIDNWKVSLKDTRELEIAQSSVDRYSIEKGDTLIIRVNGSADIVGRFIVCKESLDAIYCDHFIRMRFPIECFDPAFLSILGSSGMVRNVIGDLFVSTAGQKTINQGHLASIEILLPPLNEQHRIVAKVDELMALCNQLEQQTEASLDAHQVLVETLLATLTNSQDATELMANWARISEHFGTLFTTEQSIDQLKQTILQLAVMGKLVPQDPNDEPAAKLLERIAEEKAQLVKEKKIKKQKALPPITEDEKPFELPSGWEWARIFDVSLFSEYGSSEKTVTELPDGVPVLKMGDIQAGKVILGEHQVVSSQIEDLPNLYLKLGDVLYNRTNSAELVGKTGMFEGEDDVYTFASYLIRIRCSFNNLMPEYLNLSMNTPLFRKTQIEPHIKQQCGQANVNGTLMKSMLVSVPPVREQARLMAKTKELLSFCDQLKQRLRDSQQTQLQLTDAIVEQVL